MKTTNLIKKGRDGMQEVHKKDSKEVFSMNLQRQIFEFFDFDFRFQTKQTTGSPKKILDTAL